LADWWISGQFSNGERRRLVEAADWNGPSFASCRNAGIVARAFPMSRRHDALSFTHHAEVASLKPDIAEKLLLWAEEPIAEIGKPRPVIELRETARQRRLVIDVTRASSVKRGAVKPSPAPDLRLTSSPVNDARSELETRAANPARDREHEAAPAAGQKEAGAIAEPSEIENARTRQDCVQMLHAALTNTFTGLRDVPALLERAFEKQCWTKERFLPDGGKQPPVSFHEFVHCPYPTGLGSDYATVRELICGDVVLPNHPELLEAFDQASPEAPDDAFLSSHDRCIRLDDLSAGWNQNLAAAAVDDVIREALSAPDAPKLPAPSTIQELVATLRRWIERLAPATETVAKLTEARMHGCPAHVARTDSANLGISAEN
jgi:hypothetical protein